MSFNNLPGGALLTDLAAACPHGWAEVLVTKHRGNPTADPPQDGQIEAELGRIWGIQNVGEPPIGMPPGHLLTLLGRIEYGPELCTSCDQPRCGSLSASHICGGVFVPIVLARVTWGPRGALVWCAGHEPKYGPA